MASYSVARASLLKLHIENLYKNAARCYHPDLNRFPDIPLPIHNSEYQLFPEGGQPFNLFVPDLSELNYDDVKGEAIVWFNGSVTQGHKVIKRTIDIDLILISNQAIQTVRDIPNKIFKNNYFISNEGTIITEKRLALEKVMVSAKGKLTEISNKIPTTGDITPQVTKAWENIKLKLPSWQKSIANKLQAFQNRLSKKIAPSKKEEC
ncbi:uncharacterized protein [Halyomorpha halys]|uniref:uncharacterized protein n=1 Tax=Halyomorpha halys TaxID=286706 RepID=UPI0006D52082|nr:uncharacterized protein LOC106685977 [Halyomorpha halys]XP_014284531.1 uncharacterized protein LOC106685977 [Halyomorpha halys]